MKSIKEKSSEYRRVIKVINEHESLVDTQDSEMFEAGANYVLEQVEILLNSQRFVDNPSRELFELIEQLKK